MSAIKKYFLKSFRFTIAVPFKISRKSTKNLANKAIAGTGKMAKNRIAKGNDTKSRR
jgi:hypothetical protein